MGSVLKGGSSKTKSTSSSNSWAVPYFKEIAKDAQSQYNNGGFFDQNYFGGQDTVANMSPEQLQALQQMQTSGGNQQDVLNTSGLDALSQTLGAYDPNNPNITGAINSAIDANTTNFMRTVLPSIAAGSEMNGRTGSNREGVAQGLAMSDLNKQNLNTASNMQYQAYSQHQQEQSQALGNLSSIIKGLNSGSATQFDAAGAEQDQAQQELNGQLQAWAYHNNIPLQNLQAFQGLVSSVKPDETKATGKAPSGGGLGSMMGSYAGSKMGGK